MYNQDNSLNNIKKDLRTARAENKALKRALSFALLGGAGVGEIQQIEALVETPAFTGLPDDYAIMASSNDWDFADYVYSMRGEDPLVVDLVDRLRSSADKVEKLRSES